MPNRLEGSVKTVFSFESYQDSIIFSLESSPFVEFLRSLFRFG